MISKRKFFVRGLFVSRIFLISFLLATGVWAAGEVDTSFNPYLAHVPGGTITRVAVQPDGRIIIAGEFKFVGGVLKPNLARLMPDGSVDTSFQPPAIYTNGAAYPITALALQPDGKILIAGQFSVPRSSIARLNPDGSPDTAFNSNMTVPNLWYGNNIKVGPDGVIVFSAIRIFTSVARNYLIRLNPDGSLINQTDIEPGQYSIQPDGKILITRFGTLTRLNTNLSQDNTFAPVTTNGGIGAPLVLPDGKILIGGSFTEVNGSMLNRLARINPNGSIDLTFNINAAGPNASVALLRLLQSGKYLIGGDFTAVNGVAKNHLAVVNPDGSLDNSFTPDQTFFGIFDLAVQPDGKILVVGSNNGSGTAIIRLNADGSRDTAFQPVIGNLGTGNRVVVQPDSKILVGGSFNYVNGAVRKNLVRLNPSGSLDTGFNATSFNSPVTALDILPGGKILASDGSGIYRLNSDGSQDIVYSGAGGAVYDIKALSDGKALIAVDGGLQRYSAGGTLEGTFSVTTDGSVLKISLQSDGKILVGGSFTSINGTVRGRIARLNADGTVDTSFNPPGGASGGSVLAIDVQADGKVVIGGAFTSVNFNQNRKYLARLNADGTLDANFNPVLDNTVLAIEIQDNAKILIGGLFNSVNSLARYKYARLNPDGALDATFFVWPQFPGADREVRDIRMQSQGNILMVGAFESVNGFPALGIVRLNLLRAPRTPFDYTGDGRADISVFRPWENKWYVLSSLGGVLQQIFAINGDMPVPADYDGDGKTDYAIYRPSAGDWWSLSSQNGQQMFADWGQPGVIPLPSDFDGDTKADYIFYLPSNSTWYRYGTSTGASYIQFGLAGDKPITGDFDGDGKSDVAIFRPSTGDWWWKSSVDGTQRATHWGISTDIPAPADYDGDGKTDFAVYRPSNGTWYVYNSSNNSSTILNFGLSEDKPVPADYDGDGKSDIAVFRPNTGVWYLMRSSQGFASVQFGVSGDIPTQNAFIP